MTSAAVKAKTRGKRASVVEARDQRTSIDQATLRELGRVALELARAQSPATLPAEGFIRLRDVLRVIPVSEAAWWAGIRCGKYPPPVHLGAQSGAWRVDDIRALIKATSEAKPSKGTYRLPRAASHAEAAAEG
jgi:predicted DNA-binding transcriptional regulator AlpA